jgi:ABC-2 type transport system ATP-binding protein
VEAGRIFSLLGPNGAGKTTLIKTLLGIVRPTSGTAALLGSSFQDHSVHRSIGYLAENHRFPDFLTARQILYYYGRMSGISKSVLAERIPALLHKVNLQDWMHTRIRKYSKGMMQRMGLAHALINDPALLFLDEPTDGIDPVGRREIRDLLKVLRNEGKTIFLNSHLLSEVERISDEIAIMKQGKLLQQGALDDFLSVKQQYQLQLTGDRAKIDAIFAEMHIAPDYKNEYITIKVEDHAELNILIDSLRKHSIDILAVIPKKITLEDFFIDVLDEKEVRAT